VEIKQIKDLMAAMARTGTKRLSLKREGCELELERHDNGKISEPLEELDEAVSRERQVLQRASAALSKGKEIPIGPPSTPSTSEFKEETAGIYVTSPMVGTFYSSASPDDPPFVHVGSKIEKQTIVCIIEAMKVMNEVKAGISGTVVEILVENGHPVEFGTKLFRIS
jgi:acetyl-CoA carboxylase biotin carboxyl carrier protein